MHWRDFQTLPLLLDDFFGSSQKRRVHFIGIGGIGMSALAQILLSRGHQVSGSDAHDSPLLDTLRQRGAQIHLGHSPDNLLGNNAPVDAVIWGSAITADNPERQAATQHDIPQWHRAQLLAFFVNNAAFSIAVSGTHGKSTTSAMIAHILDKLGRNPTAILGAVYPPFASNVRLGDEDLIVVEADESDGSFTLCSPSVAVVTNVEAEHLENYDDSHLQLWHAFEQFADTSDQIVLNADDQELLERLDADGWAMTYGLHQSAHLKAREVSVGNGRLNYTLSAGEKTAGQFSLLVPGEHNLSNALAAIGACWLQHIDAEHIDEATIAANPIHLATGPMALALEDFGGVARRFQRIGSVSGITIVDDYAHHPTEVQSTLKAARDWFACPITAIFQPHRFSRTQQMGHLFGPAFEAADKVIVTELYSAFETPIDGVSGRIVFDAVREMWPQKPVHFAPTLAQARALALQITPRGGAIFTLGASTLR